MNDASSGGKRARPILFIAIFATIIAAVIAVILVVYPPDRIESVALDHPAVIDFYLAHLEYDILAEVVSSSHVKFSAINGTTSAHLTYKTEGLGTEITYQCEEDGRIVYDEDLPAMCFETDAQ
ncbi:hypothetical protein CENSYa_1105 [Cenarchaeum symbiosum A]|uniref:Uncharacterized protein n=1 Tax=Cenarchaeum symbiosum (strain A) TaxID=414004 RepID=A0RWL7_CENSY|nr:hypothetical protein CENSYa_1105 [Cenarchaeum symbiosum A]